MLKNVRETTKFPFKIYGAFIASLVVLLVGAFSIMTIFKMEGEIGKETEAKSDFESNIEKNFQILNNSVILAFYTGQPQWETQYNETSFDVIKFKTANLKNLEVDNPNGIVDLEDLEKRVLELRKFDEKIFAMIRAGKKDEAAITINGVERENKITQLALTVGYIKSNFKKDNEFDQLELEKNLKIINFFLIFLISIFGVGFLYASRALWLWVRQQGRVSSKLIETVQFKSEELDLERERNARNQKMVELGILAGGIGHEILNPISSAIMALSMLDSSLSSQSNLSEKTLKNLQRLHQSLIRVSKIVKGLKSFARDGDGDPFEKIALSETTANITEISLPKFKTSNIDLRFVGFNESLMIECNPVQLEQIIINLINNSFDAIENSESPWVEIRVEPKNENYLFSVTDSGTGIPKEIVERMFDALYTTKGVGKGTGLGLALIRKIADQHKGRLWYNFDCKNTQFCFELPKVQGQNINGPQIQNSPREHCS